LPEEQAVRLTTRHLTLPVKTTNLYGCRPVSCEIVASLARVGKMGRTVSIPLAPVVLRPSRALLCIIPEAGTEKIPSPENATIAGSGTVVVN